MVKKISRRTQAKPLSVRERIERNQWNPFERVNPAILEAIHKRNEKNKVKHLLDTIEEARW